MTDLATRADEEASSGDDTIELSDDAADGPPPTYEWAPAEPAPKSRRLWLWIGVPVAVVAAGLVATSLVIIAPGTAVAGVSVGGLTAGAAADAIAQRLARTTIVLTGQGDEAEITGADLGASVDARALADEAFATHPAWNPSTWFASPTEGGGDARHRCSRLDAPRGRPFDVRGTDERRHRLRCRERVLRRHPARSTAPASTWRRSRRL